MIGVMPGVFWRPCVNRTVEGMYHPILGAVLHHTVGSLDAAEARFNDPRAAASAHFGVGYDGEIRQWVSTYDRAWHAAGVGYGANTEWVGIETESAASGDVWGPMTDAQLSACARIMAWLAETENVQLRVCDYPQAGGLAYHSLNPPSWGVTGCPGDARIAQRQTIIDRALGSTHEEDDMPSYTVVSVRDNIGNETEIGSIVDGVLRHGNAEVQRNVNGQFVTVQHDQYVVMTQGDWSHAWETAAAGAKTTLVDLDYAKFADAVTTGFKHAVGAP